MTPQPWTKEAERNAAEALDFLCAALLRDGESIRFELKGAFPGGSAPSKISGNIEGEGRLPDLLSLAFLLCKPEGFEPPGINTPPRYSADLIIRECSANSYSAHQRLKAWTEMPERLRGEGLCEHDISRHLALHRP